MSAGTVRRARGTGAARRAGVAAVAAVAAAVLALTGCSGGDDAGDDGAAKKPASQQEGDRAPKDPGPAKAEDDDTEKVPESELEPAEGRFSEKEKEYLKERVPQGVDPAAILEAGEEACAKIESAAATDEELAREAIRSGDIANAEDAIHTLCPQYEDLL